MKKLIFLSLFFFIPLVSFPQMSIKYGAKVSPLLAFMTIVDDNGDKLWVQDASGKLGLSTGLNVLLNFSDNVGINTGMVFTSKKFVSEVENNFLTSYVKTIDIPIALQFTSNRIEGEDDDFDEEQKDVRFYGVLGVQNNFLIGVKSDYKGVASNDATNYTKFVPDLLFGAGFKWSVPKVGIFNFGVSYHYRLIYSYTHKYVDMYDKKNHKRYYNISYFAFDVSYLF